MFLPGSTFPGNTTVKGTCHRVSWNSKNFAPDGSVLVHRFAALNPSSLELTGTFAPDRWNLLLLPVYLGYSDRQTDEVWTDMDELEDNPRIKCSA